MRCFKINGAGSLRTDTRYKTSCADIVAALGVQGIKTSTRNVGKARVVLGLRARRAENRTVSPVALRDDLRKQVEKIKEEALRAKGKAENPIDRRPTKGKKAKQAPHPRRYERLACYITDGL